MIILVVGILRGYMSMTRRFLDKVNQWWFGIASHWMKINLCPHSVDYKGARVTLKPYLIFLYSYLLFLLLLGCWNCRVINKEVLNLHLILKLKCIACFGFWIFLTPLHNTHTRTHKLFFQLLVRDVDCSDVVAGSKDESPESFLYIGYLLHVLLLCTHKSTYIRFKFKRIVFGKSKLIRNESSLLMFTSEDNSCVESHLMLL